MNKLTDLTTVKQLLYAKEYSATTERFSERFYEQISEQSPEQSSERSYNRNNRKKTANKNQSSEKSSFTNETSVAPFPEVPHRSLQWDHQRPSYHPWAAANDSCAKYQTR